MRVGRPLRRFDVRLARERRGGRNDDAMLTHERALSIRSTQTALLSKIATLAFGILKNSSAASVGVTGAAITERKHTAWQTNRGQSIQGGTSARLKARLRRL